MFQKVQAIKERKNAIWSHGSQQPCTSYAPVESSYDDCRKTKSKAMPVPSVVPQVAQSSPSNNGQQQGVAPQGGSTVSLPMEKYLEILQQFQQQQKFLEEHFDDSVVSAADQPYIIRSLDIKGKEYKPKKSEQGLVVGKDEERVNGCHFNVTYTVDILENVSKKQKAILQKNNLLLSKKIWTQCVLLSGVERRIALKHCKVKFLGNSDSDENEKVNCHVSIVNGDIILLSDTAGLYEVQLSVDVNYSNLECLKNETSPREISLQLPNAVLNNFEFIIQQEKCQVRVTPSLYLEQSNVTIDDVVVTKVTSQLPSTTYLTIEWTPEVNTKLDKYLQEQIVEEEDEKEEAKKVILPLSLSSTQTSTCLIGEGVINQKSIFDYSIVNGTITSLEISINSFGLPFRIISVTGASIKEWNLVTEEHLGEAPVAEDQLEDAQTFSSSKKKLVVTFSREIERSYHLEVVSEANMGGTTALVKTPSLNTRNVVRETGTLAIIAKTVIEIVEKQRKYLRKLDVSELPHQHRQSGLPILMGYKFLESQHELQLDVIRHADVSVLSTNIESCNYSITNSSDKLLHKIEMNIYNTTKQYIRVTFPKELAKAEVWTTTVDGNTVKPGQEVKGETKIILIPLTKKQGTACMNINFVFTVPSVEMKSTGYLNLTLAQIDSPIGVLNLSLFLPKGFQYGEFEGNIKEVKNGILTNTISSNMGVFGRVMKKKASQNYYQQEMCEQTESLNSVLMDRAYDLGVNPVNAGSMDSSTGQIQFRLNRALLLENETITTSVEFKEIQKWFFERRNLSGFKPSTIIVSIIALLIAIFVYFKLVRTVAQEALSTE